MLKGRSLGRFILALAAAVLAGGGACVAADISPQCANPASKCVGLITLDCLDRLAAGAISAPPSGGCGSAFDEYRGCLAAAVERCGGIQSSASAPAFDPARLATAAQIVVTVAPPNLPPPADKRLGGVKCAKDPVCAGHVFHRFHGGRIVFEVKERDPETGAVSGWLPLPAIKSFFRNKFKSYTGLAAPTARGVTITGKIYTRGRYQDCAIVLSDDGGGALTGDLSCREMAPLAARAAL